MPFFEDDDEDSLDQYIYGEEGEEDDIDTSYDLRKSKFVDRIRLTAIHAMDRFFHDKMFWAGGTIAKSKLYKEEHVRVVMEMNIMDAYALAYYSLEKTPPDTINTQEKNWDFKLMYEAHNQCRDLKIPKCHIGGILLVYLSMCHGVDFLPVMKKLSEIKAMIAKQEKEAELRLLIKEQAHDDNSDCVE